MTEKPPVPQSDPLKPPKPKALDRVHAVAGGLISAATNLVVPVGSVGAELYKIVIQSGFDRRVGEWREEVAAAIIELRDKFGQLPEDLEKNEGLLDAVARAGVAAMKDHRREKWEMLHNALVNAALPNAPTDDLQQMFFRLVDEFSQTHVRMLRLLSGRVEDAYLNLGDFMSKNLPQPTPEQTIIRIFLGDLDAKSVVEVPPRGGHITDNVRGEISATDLGRDFLRFITAPSPPEPPAAAPPGG